MTVRELERRLSTLERRMDQLVRIAGRSPVAKDWRRTIGMFSGDEVMKAIDEEASKFREADRRRTRGANGARPRKRTRA